MTHVFVGIGSNIDREENIHGGITALTENFGKLILSPVYESRPFGFDGADFYNLVAGFTTLLDIDEVIRRLREIEFQFGRSRKEPRFSSRTLDIDLLLFGNLVNEGYQVPRRDITEFPFVLCPLAIIAPDLEHPVSGKRFGELWQDFDKRAHAISQVDINLTTC
ncbi:MAG: 2-amino-4-hydroxy-6-hydroxymethyldihydropteridine diphosphokinase [Gammaproteobacteria bacterium RBG_16_51_14]|nr:MAG: 2-amino-4-hydroxy-6-hydroxymethyldihydropteridine diphosphokinase [Gammaproteobacteria bacterium RBG_16_51_14]